MNLTRSQLGIVALVAEGLTNKVIARRLGVEEATVKAHVGQSIKRLGFSNRVQLAVWFVRREIAEARDRSFDAMLDRRCTHQASREAP